ncbi:hypothetical protein D3C71_2237680 [compost metagenome]
MLKYKFKLNIRCIEIYFTYKDISVVRIFKLNIRCIEIEEEAIYTEDQLKI